MTCSSGISSDADFLVTITNPDGVAMAEFNLSKSDRCLLSVVDNVIDARKLKNDEYYFSRATIKDVVSELMSKN